MGMGTNGGQQTAQRRPHLCVGILAHVDAGKTTLAESLLYTGGAIRRAGRVDHGDAHLDTHEIERARGITIFSSQAELNLKRWGITLLDTPGHVDFSAEMERTLWVLDYAILVISGADGVQGHVRTLWKLLEQYQIPTFLFVNKMDQPGTRKEAILAELKEQLDEHCVDFSVDRSDPDFLEEAALCEDRLLESFLAEGTLTDAQLAEGIAGRHIFPCFFGSALKQEGIEEFLEGLDTYMQEKAWPESFGARVYKIGRDDGGSRLSYLKVTGGTLKVKQLLTGSPEGEAWEEKTDQLRIYEGASYTMVNEAAAGQVLAVTGLAGTRAGEGLGFEEPAPLPALEPVLTYQLLPPRDCNLHELLQKLKRLEEEFPELHILWKEEIGEIHIRVMGEVQLEILQQLMQERFGVEVSFGPGSIIYKETIADTVEGVGHYEPLRHYAEVHLVLEPLERGSGLVLDSCCSEDALDRNWQRLVLTHLAERIHPGVLTGSEITDMKITLAAGRAHVKHTEGGDFRQATYRALRQGLMQADGVLLEPYYAFRLEVPPDRLGRAMADIQAMMGSFGEPDREGSLAVLTGTAPVEAMQGYAAQVSAYTRGEGHLFCELDGYGPCRNPEEVIAASGYDPEADVENPAGSVFCAHGGGFYVPWDQVKDYMHLESVLQPRKEELPPKALARQSRAAAGLADPKELEEIFVRTYGPINRERQGVGRTERVFQPKPEEEHREIKLRKSRKEYLLVDGYNIIFAWDDLKELSEINLEAARGSLMDRLCNLQGALGCELILVFDAYRVEGGQREIFSYHNIHVVYTKEAETADQYIEKTVHEIGRKYQVTVATSDGLEQVIIMGQGARRMSVRGLRELMEASENDVRDTISRPQTGGKTYLLDNLSPEVADFLRTLQQEQDT